MPAFAGVVALVLVVALVALVALALFAFRPGSAPPGSSTPSPSTTASPVVPSASRAGSSADPSKVASASSSWAATPSQGPTPSTGSPEPTSSPPFSQPGATVGPDRAPQTAGDFDLDGQVVDIGFPLRADASYHYRDNWLERRSGPPQPYNHARLTSDGQLLRLHDGIDLYAPEGEPVLAPFDGTVIDPATKWTPWEPDRYGLTVVIESDEPNSEGYMAVLVHLETVWVDIGQHVSRGEVIGALGETGNAEGVKPQLHFELRAPFLLDWSPMGENREVDAFNPYPSLVAADPHT